MKKNKVLNKDIPYTEGLNRVYKGVASHGWHFNWDPSLKLQTHEHKIDLYSIISKHIKPSPLVSG
jgi:hypothetical protein